MQGTVRHLVPGATAVTYVHVRSHSAVDTLRCGLGRGCEALRTSLIGQSR
jgi:hypothetical protein